MLMRRLLAALLVLMVLFTNIIIVQGENEKNYYVYCDGNLVKDSDGSKIVYGYKIDGEIYVDANIFSEYIKADYKYYTSGRIDIKTDSGTIDMNVNQKEYAYVLDKKASYGDLVHPPKDINSRAHIPLGETMKILGKTMMIDEANLTVSVYYSSKSPDNVPVTGIKLNKSSFEIEKDRKPESLTREKLAMFLVKSFNLTGSGSVSYKDVPQNSEYYQYILKVSASGIMKGYEDGSFQPDKTVTRGEYAEAVYKALKYQPTTRNFFVTDLDFVHDGYSMESHWAYDYAKTLIDAGLMELNKNEAFEPEEEMLLDTEGQIIPVISPAGATNKKVNWKSSNENVAVVDKTGKITGKNPGKAVITVTTEDGSISKTCDVTVKAIVPTPTDDLSAVKITIGSTTGKEGGSVRVPIRFDNVPSTGINNCDFIVKYDDEKLEYVKCEAGEILDGAKDNFNSFYSKNVSDRENGAYLAYDGTSLTSKTINKSGVFAYLELKIKQGAGNVKLPVEILQIGSIAGLDLEDLTVKVDNGYITVLNPTQKPTATPVPSSGNPYVPPLPPAGGDSSSTTIVNTPAATATPTAIKTATPTGKQTVTPTASAKTTPAVSKKVEPTAKYPGAPNDIKKHWAEQYINKLVGMGIVKGFQDGSIKPDSLLTRAEVAVIIVKTRGLTTVEKPENKFADDAKIPAWAKPYVYAGFKAGIIKGYDDKTFRPSGILTRSEAVVMIMKAFGQKESAVKLNFKDTNTIPKWAIGYTTGAYELKLINGYKEDDTIRPFNKVTRAEAFTIIAKGLDLKK